MSGLGGFLLAVGLADLVAGGAAGETDNRLRCLLGALSAAWAAAVAGWRIQLGGSDLILYTGIVAGTSAVWIGLRFLSVRRPRMGFAALSFLAAGSVAVVALGQRWVAGIPGLDRWLAESPLPALAVWPSERWLLLVGGVAFLTATSNAIVRVVLRATGTEFERSRRRLRGGRVIGALERWLIFGLAIAGEPTAAALIVSAKSLLRFPELSRAAQEPSPVLVDADANPLTDSQAPIPAVDYITEYFLMGSLVSWTLALGLSLLFL